MMKYFSLIFLFLLAAACQNATQQQGHSTGEKSLPSTGNFGNEVNFEQAVAADRVPGLFTTSDTVAATIHGHISASCKHSGCWMDLDLGNDNALHVTFEEEAFTVPLDAAGKNAIAQGIAIRELIPVETLRNYARDEGKSEEEVASITEPVYYYEFIADGVLIEE
jgi:hypothetical protein